ncbi:LPS export ABC transporter periplasmic protein LptC [Pseudohongiella sp.]|uniref:LPS export ABC transporter periplasmic protein LptC n=1 Tax=marine sediment metagenome TaxID=412755 RepID=A0A0F9Y0M9_9ZZZZ|nr:LPS export ABC transporter periplasmic protein LptC [Pseudohongiella sp.]HDZ10453.1 LPS export ABC transporter periplasmic protein LptC [Pseudohongiella sp.]HEA62210.1 LPS export ABC transporter periplasmic protein LptC [Pseudohongiella sp.]
MKRLRYRWLLALIPAILIAWLLTERTGVSPVEEAGVSTELNPETGYEGFGRGIRSVIYDANGQMAYTLSASQQRVFPGQVTELTAPVMQMFEGNRERWNISAASGRIRATSGGDILELNLTDAVQILHRSEDNSNVRLTSNRLTVEPPTQTMFTDARVRVTGKGLEQTSQGMHADLSVDTITFLSDIQGRYYRVDN